MRIEFDEATTIRIEEAARRLSTTPEELIRASLAEKLEDLDRRFKAVAEYVIEKNAELYRSLA